jgi:mutator protein MutT
MDADDQTGPHQEPTVVAVAVVVDRGRALVGRRPAGVPLAGLCEVPGGKVHQGETPAGAAVRECREETGLEVEVVAPYSVVEHRYPHGLITLHFFACRLLSPGKPSHPPYRWVSIDELDEDAFPAANAGLIRQLAKSV